MAIDDDLMERAESKAPGDDGAWDADGMEVSDPSKMEVRQQVPDIDPVRGDAAPEEPPEAVPGEEKLEEDEVAEAAEEEGADAEGDEDEWEAPFLRDSGSDADAGADGMQALRDELAALRQQLAGAPAAGAPDALAFDAERDKLEARIDGLWQDREKADLDGDTAKARTVDANIRKAERALTRIDIQEIGAQQSKATEKTSAELRTEVHRTRAQSKLDETREELLDRYPAFDKESKHFHAGMEREAMRLYRAFYGQGDVSAEKALRDAVGYVVKAARASLPRSAEEADGERVEQARRRNAEAAPKARSAARKGVSGARLGRSSKLPQPSKMTDKEIQALPDATRSRLRGDALES